MRCKAVSECSRDESCSGPELSRCQQAVSRVVVCGEDRLTSVADGLPRRARTHRGLQASRRHARVRRGARRRACALHLMEDGRPSAAAAVQLPRVMSPGGMHGRPHDDPAHEVAGAEGMEAGAAEDAGAAMETMSSSVEQIDEVTTALAEEDVPGQVRMAAGEVARAAARVIQRCWRRGATSALETSIERGWVGARARRLGSLDAHVSFLQWVFRRSRQLRRGCWLRGGMRGVMTVLRVALFCRQVRPAELASESEFAEQRARAERVLDWWRPRGAPTQRKALPGSNSADIPKASSSPRATVVSKNRQRSRKRAALQHSSGVSGAKADAKPHRLASLQKERALRGVSSCTPVTGNKELIICSSTVKESENQPR